VKFSVAFPRLLTATVTLTTHPGYEFRARVVAVPCRGRSSSFGWLVEQSFIHPPYCVYDREEGER
jgi:hypothetical protein